MLGVLHGENCSTCQRTVRSQLWASNGGANCHSWSAAVVGLDAAAPRSPAMYSVRTCAHTYRTVTSRISRIVYSHRAHLACCSPACSPMSMCAVCVSRVDVDAKSLDDASKFQQASCESLRFVTTAIITASYSTCNMQGCWISPSGTGPFSRRAACIAALSMAAHAPCYLPDLYPLCQQAGHHGLSWAAPGWVRTSARPHFTAFRRIANKTLLASQPEATYVCTLYMYASKFEF